MLRRISEISIYLLVGGAIAAAGAGHAAASEMFVCADGRTLKVDSSNRAKLADDPCVKDWFARSAPKPVVGKEPSRRAGEKATVHVRRYTRSSRAVVDPTN